MFMVLGSIERGDCWGRQALLAYGVWTLNLLLLVIYICGIVGNSTADFFPAGAKMAWGGGDIKLAKLVPLE